MSDAKEIALIKAQREQVDPHHRVLVSYGSPAVAVYCNTSQRTEGTVRMEGHICSYCGFELPKD